MENKVKVHPYQEVPASEINAIQTYAEDSVDAIVKELLFDEARFTGFATTKVDSMNISVGAGRLVTGGRIYRAAVATSLSLISYVPTTGSRIVLVVVAGDEVETGTATRKFLVDVATRQTQPKAVSTRIARQAVVSLVAGAAAANPVRPSIPAGTIVVASLVLTPSGIAGAVDAETVNRALSLETTTASVAVLAAALRKANSQLETLRSEIAGLAKAQQGKADQRRVAAIEDAMLFVREKIDMPDTRVTQGYDDFGSDSETDTANPANTSEIDSGRMVFGRVERIKKMTALLNPNDSKVDKTASGLIMPAGVDTLRIECDDKDGEVAIASYQVVQNTLRKLRLSRWWWWYRAFPNPILAQAWLRQQKALRLYNPETDAHETFDLTAAEITWKVEHVAKNNKWKLFINWPYWERGAVTTTYAGARLCQTFLCAQSGWHSRIDLGLTSVAATGDVHVAVCELTDAGYPDENRVLETATVAVAALKAWPNWTVFNCDPFWLERGERYGLIITTAGNHKVGVSTSNDLTNGTLMTWTSGSIWSVDLAKDACFRLYGKRFNATNVIVDIEDLTLPGGIQEIRSAMTGYEPKGTRLVVQARIAGVWRNLDEDDETVLAGAPTQVPLRFVFIGTKDLMPAIDMSKSALVASRPLSTSVHISTERTLPFGVTTTSVKVIEEAVGFKEAQHDWAVHIMHGATFSTAASAASVVTNALANGRVQRTWTFSGLPSISAYKIRTTKSTGTAATEFDVDYRRDWAL